MSFAPWRTFSEQQPPKKDEEDGNGRKLPSGFEKLLKKSRQKE